MLIPNKETFVIKAGWLIDGTGLPIQENVRIHIKETGISCIEQSDNSKLFNEKDYSECTILPGLIDSHVHLSISGTIDPDVRINQFNKDFDTLKHVILYHINKLLSYGVVAVRDGGDKGGYALRYKNELGDGSPICLNVCGKAFHKPGRYGKLIGRTPLNGKSLAKAILEQETGINHVKIINSGINSLTEFGKKTLPQFDLQEMTEAVKAAESKGLRVMVHANGEIPVQIAIEAGCHSVEHGFFMGGENLRKMADKRIFWVPTACTMKAYSQKATDVAQKTLDHQLEQIRQARNFGVPIALGTDAGSPGVYHGHGVIEELKLLMMGGFSIQDAIMCATSNGAKLLSINNAGILHTGMDATLIIVKGCPSDLPESLSKVEKVYIRGTPVYNIQN